MSFADVVILVVTACIVAAVIFFSVKKKKSGKCSGCPYRKDCNGKADSKK